MKSFREFLTNEAKEEKFKLGDASDVFVKKTRKGYEVRICGEYEGNDYTEVDSIIIPEKDVFNKSQNDDYEGMSLTEIAARLAFYKLDFCNDPLDC